MDQDQSSRPQRRTLLSIPIVLGCGCLLILLCLPAGFAALKLAVAGLFAGGESSEPAWSPDGKSIAFASSRAGLYDIYLMNSDGSNVTRLTNAFFSWGILVHNWTPAWSPDGTQLAFVSNRNGRDDIYIMNRDGSQVRRLTNSRAAGKEGINDPDWSPDGQQILFTFQEGTYGDLLPAYGGPPLPTADIYRIDVDSTNLTRLTELAGYVQSPTWSPDGSKIAFVLVKENVDIYVMEADGTNIMQLTKDSAVESDLDWSPDGSRIAFVSGDIYHNNIYVMNADGTNRQKITNTPGLGDSSPSWSPDGHQIVFDSQEPETRINNIFLVNDDGSNLMQLTGN